MPLDWRPLAFWRTHSSSRSIAFWRAFSPDSSCFRRCVLLLQPRRIVALPRNAAAAVEFEDPLGGVVEEVAVMGDRDDGAGEVLQELLQPFDRLGVEVVGRLVEQQHVGLGQQQAAQRDAALLATGELADLGVPRRQAQRVGGDLRAGAPGVRVAGGEDAFQALLLRGQLVEVGAFLGVGGVDLFELLLRVEHFGRRLPRRPRARSCPDRASAPVRGSRS